VRYHDFTTVTRSHTFAEPVATARDLNRAARELLARTDAGAMPVRLLGIAAGGLVEASAPRQLGLEARPWDEVEKAVAEVRDRFGRSAVDRARLSRHPSDPETRPGRE
jgi:DNA polymerase-4